MYSGVFRDVYGEFMIQVNEEYLSFRGEMTLTSSHKHFGFSQQVLEMKSLPDRLWSRKNRFHNGLYCLVGFVLVSIKDVMKLLDDNQWKTDTTATTAVGTRAISAS